VYGNGYLTENHHEHEQDLIEEDWTMADQTQSSSFSQDSMRFERDYEEHDLIEEDTIGSDECI